MGTVYTQVGLASHPLDDGRIFVVHYTDDTSAASTPNPHNFGVPWIRGTFLSLSDLR